MSYRVIDDCEFHTYHESIPDVKSGIAVPQYLVATSKKFREYDFYRPTHTNPKLNPANTTIYNFLTQLKSPITNYSRILTL